MKLGMALFLLEYDNAAVHNAKSLASWVGDLNVEKPEAPTLTPTENISKVSWSVGYASAIHDHLQAVNCPPYYRRNGNKCSPAFNQYFDESLA